MNNPATAKTGAALLAPIYQKDFKVSIIFFHSTQKTQKGPNWHTLKNHEKFRKNHLTVQKKTKVVGIL